MTDEMMNLRKLLEKSCRRLSRRETIGLTAQCSMAMESRA